MLKTLMVVDEALASEQSNNPDIISFDTYLEDYPKLGEPKTRLINLCDTEKYLSRGYYCSLLAESRKHQVFPSVRTINDMRGDARVLSAQQAGMGKKEKEFLSSGANPDSSLAFMGVAQIPELQKVAARVFRRYSAPILRINCDINNQEVRVTTETFDDLTEEERREFLAVIVHEGDQIPSAAREKEYRWDMAILVNDDEKVPPSNKRAISKFVQAAAKLGIRAEVLHAAQLLDVARFDALFIRETTAIDHHTYRIARDAETKGLVVIDDPTSILRCCNKVYLHDAFSYQQVPCPKTDIVAECSQQKLDELESQFSYPMVVKMPEGSFSKGVFKVEDRASLEAGLRQLLTNSALALVQEYLYTDYDWRIGILNGRPLYACRYFMAPKHWQIYNHESRSDFSGGFETMPTHEVPKPVLEAAQRAAKVVGNGLYGVDIKAREKEVYVIEVNDNPSLDYKVEDGFLGDELYTQVMAEFHRRLEARGN